MEGNSITVPASIDAAAAELVSIEANLNTNRWKQALYVAAAVAEEGITAFCRRRIPGLLDHEAIGNKIAAVDSAVAAGLTTAPTLGARVKVPDAPYEDHYRPRDKGTLRRSPESITEAMKDPRLAAAAADALDGEAAVRVAQRTLRDPEQARETMRDKVARTVAPRAAVQAARDEVDMANPARAEHATDPDSEDFDPMPEHNLAAALTVLIAATEQRVRLIRREVEQVMTDWPSLPADSRDHLLGGLVAARGDLTALIEGTVSDEQISTFLAGGSR